MVRDNVVAVAYPGMKGNEQIVITPDGKLLAKEHTPSETLEKGLAAWRKLPASERQPRDPGGLERLKGYDEPPTPPEKGLVLRAHSRALLVDKQGDLARPRRMLMAQSYGWAAEPQLDHAWLTEAEWKSLVPAEPKVGQTHPVPEKLVERIARFHLLDKGLGTPDFLWDTVSGSMTLTVTEVGKDLVQMRVEGKAQLGGKDGLPVRFHGVVRYSDTKKAFTRFDLVAIGESNGDRRSDAKRKSNLCMSYEVGPGLTPVLAVAFELVPGTSPLDRVPPYALMIDSAKSYNRPYFR